MCKNNMYLLLVISLIFVSCSSESFLNAQDKTLENLPDNIEKYNGFFSSSAKSPIIEIRKNGEFYIGKNKTERENLKTEFDKLLAANSFVSETNSKENDIFIKADKETDFSNIIELLKSFPLSSKHFFQLAVRTKRNELSYLESGKPKVEILGAFSVQNFCDGWKINDPQSETFKPNPMTLVIEIAKDKTYKLNQDSVTLDELTTKIREIFIDREENLVFKEKSNEIEKSVFVLAPPTAKFADVVPVLESLTKTDKSPTICVMFDRNDPNGLIRRR
jgi:biopolymer transport protein ExbD